MSMKNSIDSCLLTTRDVSMYATRVTRHTSIRYLSSCHKQALTLVHPYSSLLQLSVTLGQRGHFERMLCTKCTLHSNHRLTELYCNTENDFLAHREQPFSLYTHSHRLAAEMWTTMKNNLLRERNFEFLILSVQVRQIRVLRFYCKKLL